MLNNEVVSLSLFLLLSGTLYAWLMSWGWSSELKCLYSTPPPLFLKENGALIMHKENYQLFWVYFFHKLSQKMSWLTQIFFLKTVYLKIHVYSIVRFVFSCIFQVLPVWAKPLTTPRWKSSFEMENKQILLTGWTQRSLLPIKNTIQKPYTRFILITWTRMWIKHLRQ